MMQINGPCPTTCLREFKVYTECWNSSVMLSEADPNRFPPLSRNRSDFLDKYIVLALLHNHYNVKIDIDELSSSEENG